VSRLKPHLKVFLYAVIFGMAAYGVIQLGVMLHRSILN
jgi:hypothetical protein|tara:strand:- start:1356 stop:1469 length:114 start_codon:yes stop_codon:yes gene_type:complete